MGGKPPKEEPPPPPKPVKGKALFFLHRKFVFFNRNGQGVHKDHSKTTERIPKRNKQA